ncbi:unnamed protein product [Gongylonema pulchrum]|uniref:Uncharacterized protein n=1 Tax=Gongylonema pulchrum TaxID=637853 RepID=A0A183D277_9BILA|nr:unnamed protein product [Gongylonema pulchrum]
MRNKKVLNHPKNWTKMMANESPKRRQIGLVCLYPNSYFRQRLGFHPPKPIIPIALSRSRRQVAKVDYNFGAYDELIQEAVKNIDESAAQRMHAARVRTKSEAGRGKDMANIINAEKQRISSSVDESCEDDGNARWNFF